MSNMKNGPLTPSPRTIELWDAYDAKLNKIGDVTLVRGEDVPDGYFHLVSEIIVKHTDGSYLIMQRDRRKHLGGMWEATQEALLYREKIHLHVLRESYVKRLE